MSLNKNIEIINNNFKKLSTNINNIDYSNYENLKFKINKINSKLEELGLDILQLNEEVLLNKVELTPSEKEEVEVQKRSDEIINTFKPYMLLYTCFQDKIIKT